MIGGIPILENEEFIQEFVEEARLHIQQVESNLLGLANNYQDDELINELFRSVHSIKGTAGFFGLDNIVGLSHSMESLFGDVRNKRIQLDNLSIDALLSANDYLKDMVDHVASSHEMDISPFVDKLGGFSHNPPMVGLAGEIQDNSPSNLRQSLSNIVIDESIRVPIGLLDNLMNLASELVLGRNQLLRILEGERKEIEGLDPILQNIDHITSQIQEGAMQTRMQPLGNVFNKFPRLIRELSRQLKKDIKLEMDGNQVELDKSIIESLGDPLTHIIRNAADHGIEDPEERESLGKERQGTIRIGAFHEGGYVSINISDDGSGIDTKSLKKKILGSGLKTKEELADMDERQILDHVFLPGLSTASSVTDVSGRGVGMDVVRTNIERMGGTIEIQNRIHQGSSFILNLPLTLAIISSIIVEASGQKFALPQADLQEMVRVKPGNRDRRLQYIKGSMVLRLRGGLLPIVSLSEVLGLEMEGENPKRSRDLSEIIRILIIKIGSKRFGLMVDGIHDDEEILVKPLPIHLKSCKCYSGVTILGDGDIAMILDSDGIAGQAKLEFTDHIKELDEENDEEKTGDGHETMLLFSCLGPEIMGIPLSMASRVEEIYGEDIQHIGKGKYIKYRDQSLRLVSPHDHLPIHKGEYGNTKLYVIIPKLEKYPMGLLVHKIHDTAILDTKLKEQDTKVNGIDGTTFWQDKIISILNLEELIEMSLGEDNL
ncbi:MAG TPA: chemotaxis protein CheA [Clostridia bacterium]|nr:chemotaxis protein CheA [Clostridia bacterium]